MKNNMNQLRNIDPAMRGRFAAASSAAEVAGIASEFGVALSATEVESFTGSGMRELQASELTGVAGGMAPDHCPTWSNGSKTWGF